MEFKPVETNLWHPLTYLYLRTYSYHSQQNCEKSGGLGQGGTKWVVFYVTRAWLGLICDNKSAYSMGS